MATRALAEETKVGSDANPRQPRKHGDPDEVAKHPKGGRSGLEVKRVQPVRPEREKFGPGVQGTKKYNAASQAYETALEAYRAGEVTEAGGNVQPEPGQPVDRKAGEKLAKAVQPKGRARSSKSNRSAATTRTKPTTDAKKLQEAGIIKSTNKPVAKSDPKANGKEATK
jgi:hypothetical protein